MPAERLHRALCDVCRVCQKLNEVLALRNPRSGTGRRRLEALCQIIAQDLWLSDAAARVLLAMRPACAWASDTGSPDQPDSSLLNLLQSQAQESARAVVFLYASYSGKWRPA